MIIGLTERFEALNNQVLWLKENHNTMLRIEKRKHVDSIINALAYVLEDVSEDERGLDIYKAEQLRRITI